MARLLVNLLVVGFGGFIAACTGADPSSTSTGSGGTTAGIGGTASGSGGTSTTGGAASGGAANGEQGPSTGGTTTGGSNNGTGGAATSTTGGTPAIGGAASGGVATGGKATGGASTGGSLSGGTSSGTGGAAISGGSTGTGGGPAGTCTTVAGTAFPAITDYTARDGGFGPVEATRRTGDASLGTDASGVANTVAIFRPAAAKYGQGGVRHPIIVWGNGSTNTVDIWAGFLGRVATYGFVVVAPEQTQVTADHMNKALDYVLSLANDPTSGDCGKVDATKLGSTGYSRGGMGAIAVGSNARITATFFFASNGNVANLKAPWGVVGGDADTTFNWTAISAAVSGSTQPAFGAALAGIDHNRVAGQAKAQAAYIGWMRWRFMGDPAGHDMFVGSSCQICGDTAFSGVVKTSTFDSL